jgi:hypothetical protein
MSDVEKYQDPARHSLAVWAQEADAAHTLATALCQTNFVPAAYKGKPADATACLLKGAELGLSPLAALSSINVIQGTPALSAMAMRALVQSQGHRIWIEESGDKKAVARGQRKGEEIIHESTWTIQRAERLGLTGKSNWKSQPEAMLIARATSEVARLVAADSLLGVGYSVEELTDDAPAPPPRTVKRAPVEPPPPTAELTGHEAVIDEAVKAVANVQSSLGGEVIDAEVVETGPPAEVMTQPQRAALHASFKEAGITDRTRRLAYASEVVGRTLATSAELTRQEASDVIDALKGDK